MLDRTKYMDATEIAQLIKSCKEWEANDLRYGRVNGVKTWAVIDTALQTGLRCSEICALQIEDFDSKRRALTVIRLKKKKRVPETMPISKDLAAHLRKYIGDRKTGPMFIGRKGRNLSRAGMSQIFKRAAEHAHLPKSLSIHACRHSLGMKVLKQTGNLRLVQKALGHANIQATCIYADVDFETLQNALDG